MGDPYKGYGPKIQAKSLYNILTQGYTASTYWARNQDGPSIKTYKRWLDHFETYGEIPLETSERKKRNKGKRRKFGMTIACQEILVKRAKEFPTRFLHEYREFLDFNGHGFYSLQTISRVLQQAGLTKAKLERMAAEADVLLQQEFINRIHSVERLEMFICVDETHKDRRAGQRAYGWGYRGRPHLLLELFLDRSKQLYTVIAAADIDGFVESACLAVPRPTTVDIETKLHYVRNILCPHLGSYLLGEPRSVVTMDNAPVNYKAEIEQLINDRGAIIIWTAPYSPQHHPIEPCFEDYKDTLKSDKVAMASHWYEKHLIALRNSVNRRKMLSYMKHSWMVPIPSSYDEEEWAIALAVQQQAFIFNYLASNL
jgi:transposase